MPQTRIRFFRDEDGSVPILEWLGNLERRNRRAFVKCVYLIDVLRERGRELRRPRADMLRDGIYELRTEVGRVNYRILYGFVGRDVALISHGLTKTTRFQTRK